MILPKQVARYALLLSFLAPTAGLAQDPEPNGVKPNILLIVDTSGSMEYKTGTDEFPICTPNAPASINEKSRWVEVIEALSGDINNYSCEAVPRNTPDFNKEFGMPQDSGDPPDSNYRNPYHRALSYGCGVTPNRTTNLTNAFEWAAPLEAQYPIDPDSLTGCTTPFSQVGNGVIDTFDDLVRFGLMSFDPLPDGGVGHNSFGPNYTTGVRGTWSYLSGSPATGHPANCAVPSMNQVMEVGVRNGAAPSSEGKMIPFGDQFSNDIDDGDRHNRIQQVLLATRPYGGTPLNGALDDARYFFLDDNDVDPLDADPTNPSLWISPRYDEYVNCGCREQHIVLITDGEPNLDLRPHCEQTGSPDGECPFPDDPAAILASLYDAPGAAPAETLGAACAQPHLNGQFFTHRIRTHVVGYSAGTYQLGGNTYNCSSLQTDHSDWNALGGVCDSPAEEALRVCCALHQFARAGSNPASLPTYDADGDGLSDSQDPDPKDSDGVPHIAPDGNALSAVMTDLFSKLVKQSASATRPVRSPGIGAADDELAGFRLLTSYDTNAGSSNVWRGKLERLRFVCSGGVATEQAKDLEAGDDFAHLAAMHKTSREFVTWYPGATYTAESLKRSIRPNVPNTIADGVSASGTQVTRITDVGSAFVDDVTPTALDLTAGFCQNPTASNAGACRDRVMNWLLGFPDGQGNERCATLGDATCSVIGDIMHSTPVIVNRPSAPLEDETYTSFAQAHAGRMMMAYVSSNDGFLHGFATSPNIGAGEEFINDDRLTERFAAIPPLLLPELKGQYPGNRLKLLDGVAVVQDVVATDTGASGYPFRLERLASQGGDAGATGATWRTILVQGFGDTKSGYFALDITDAGKPSEGATSGPRLLWQLTSTEVNGQALFGSGGTPTIATVYLEENGVGKEVAVAILPGGKGGSPSGNAAQRSDPNRASPETNTHFRQDTMTEKLSGTAKPREAVNEYAAAGAARSLTIVRLDSGEILRTFRRSTDLPTPTNDIASSVITDENSPTPVFLDSPITGTPAAFPAGPGMIADRVFVGDQDGTLWRVDVSNPVPANWEMKLFHDAYGGKSHNAGQPITSPPMLSVDEMGQITVAFGTGVQDLSGGAGITHYVYSLTEKEYSGSFVSQLNWFEELEDGEHMLGPMSLLASTLYFATYDPAQVNACVSGSAKAYGLHFTQAATLGDAASGGNPRLRTADDPTNVEDFIYLSDKLADQDGSGAGGVTSVFGFSLEFTPSCYEVDPQSSAYLAGGQKVTNPSSSKLQMVFQTASSVQSSEGALDFETGIAAIELTSPPQASTILSWAAILD